MKKFITFCFLSVALSVFAGVPTNAPVPNSSSGVAVTIGTNGVLTGYSTNVFSSNTNLLNRALSSLGITPGGGGSSTNGLISATDAINKIQASTNNLGSAAFVSVFSLDTNGAALWAYRTSTNWVSAQNYLTKSQAADGLFVFNLGSGYGLPFSGLSDGTNAVTNLVNAALQPYTNQVTTASIVAAGGVTNNQTGVTLGGSFTGNAAGLTNVPAGSVSGIVASANYAQSSASSQSLTAGGGGPGAPYSIALVNGTGNYVGSVLTNAVNLSGTFAGNGAGLTNLPSSGGGVTANTITNNWSNYSPLILPSEAMANKPLTGQPWAAQNLPIVMFYTTFAWQNGVYENEGYITNTIALMKADGTLANCTNNYSTWFYNDGAWEGLRISATNWSSIMTNWGTLTWSPTNYPDGLPYVINLLHTNNLKWMGQIYNYTNRIPVGATELLSSPSGGYVIYTNGVGAWPTNVYGLLENSTTPDTMAGDIAALFNWGADGICLADASSDQLANFQELDQLAGNMMVAPSLPFNLNISSQPLPYVKYGQWTNSTYDFTHTNQYMTSDALSVFGRQMLYMTYQTPHGAGQTHALGYMTRANHNSVFYDNAGDFNGDTSGGLDCRRLLRDFPTTKHAYEGSYVVSYGANTDPTLVTAALFHKTLILGYTNELAALNYSFNGTMLGITNALFRKIHLDPLQNWPTTWQDLGSGIGSIVGEPLQSGYAVGVFNEGAGTTNFTVTAAMMGLPTNASFSVYSVIRQVYRGIFTGSYTTNGMVANASDLLLITPISTAVNLTSGNATVTIVKTTTTNGTAYDLAAAGASYPNYVIAPSFQFKADGSSIGTQIAPSTLFNGNGGDYWMWGLQWNTNSGSYYPMPQQECYGRVQGTNMISTFTIFSTNAVSGRFTMGYTFAFPNTNLVVRFPSGLVNYFQLPAGTNITLLTFTNKLNPFNTSNPDPTGGYYGGGAAVGSIVFTNACLFIQQINGSSNIQTTNGSVWLMSAKYSWNP